MSLSTTKLKSRGKSTKRFADPLPKGVRTQVNDMVQRLSSLNRQIEPSRDIQESYEVACLLQSSLKPSPIRLSQAQVVQYQGLTFIAMAFDGPVLIELLKLSDLERALPLLVSFGAHTPNNLEAADNIVFAFTTGVNLQPGQLVQIETVFTGGRNNKAVLGVSDPCEDTLLALMGLIRNGQRLLEQLLSRNQAQAQSLRQLVLNVAEFGNQFEAPYSGSVDLVQKGLIEGWVWCPWKPNRRYEVQAWCQDRLVGFASADQLRDDLKRKKKGDGTLKFSIRLSTWLNDGETHWIQLRILGQGELDRTLDFDKPIRYRSAKSSFERPQDGLMGYALDQKVALALSMKLEDPAKQALLTDTVPKISLCLEFGQTAQARELIAALEEQFGSDGFLTLKQAEAYLIDGNHDKALRLFSKVVRRARKFIWGHLGLAYTLLKLGDDNKALAALENAFALSPYYPGLKQSIDELSARLLATGAIQQDPRELARRILQTRSALLREPSNRDLSDQFIDLLSERRPHLRGPNLDSPVGLPETAALRHSRALLEACSGLLRKK